MSGQADIIKKASLKVKVVRSKTGAAGLQGVRYSLCRVCGAVQLTAAAVLCS